MSSVVHGLSSWPRIIADLSFDTLPVTQSFRFETPEMQWLARALRAGGAVTVPTGAATDVDVVLASWWKPLWAVADNVLPLAFGQINNRTDAAMAVLLERLVSSHFGHLPTRAPEAAMVLGLDPEILRTDPSLFAPVLDRLEGGTPRDATAALAQLRTTLTSMGSRPFRKMKDTDEADRIELLGALGRRLGTAHLIPGMTIHQAKGREWANVGVYLQPDEEHHLAAGLSQERPSDRALYVGLTRAKRSVCRV